MATGEVAGMVIAGPTVVVLPTDDANVSLVRLKDGTESVALPYSLEYISAHVPEAPGQYQIERDEEAVRVFRAAVAYLFTRKGRNGTS